jgi:hypothetical protein
MSPYNPKPPVVLLVYANDRIDDENHLRNLKEEIDAIRKALRPVDGSAPDVALVRHLFQQLPGTRCRSGPQRRAICCVGDHR